MIAGTLIVHIIEPTALSATAAYRAITADERERAGQFRFKADALRWISFRAQMRMILGATLDLPPVEVPLRTGENGKPLLDAPWSHLHFNLSHCADLGLLALCGDGPVGIDLESRLRGGDLLECEAMFCHPKEIEALPFAPAARADRLLEIWTAKEAVLKALGTGLVSQPELLRIEKNGVSAIALSDQPFQGIETQRIQCLDHDRLAGHLAVVSAPSSIEFIRFELVNF